VVGTLPPPQPVSPVCLSCLDRQPVLSAVQFPAVSGTFRLSHLLHGASLPFWAFAACGAAESNVSLGEMKSCATFGDVYFLRRRSAKSSLW